MGLDCSDTSGTAAARQSAALTTELCIHMPTLLQPPLQGAAVESNRKLGYHERSGAVACVLTSQPKGPWIVTMQCRDDHMGLEGPMTPVGFEPTQLVLVELESTPLDHSGKVSIASAQASNARPKRGDGHEQGWR